MNVINHRARFKGFEATVVGNRWRFALQIALPRPCRLTLLGKLQHGSNGFNQTIHYLLITFSEPLNRNFATVRPDRVGRVRSVELESFVGASIAAILLASLGYSRCDLTEVIVADIELMGF